MEGLKMKYFVLNPTKDDDYGVASRNAIRTYAKSIKKTNAQLASELENWVNGIISEPSGAFGRTKP